MRGDSRRHLILGTGAVLLTAALLLSMWIHAPVADGVTRSIRLSGNAVALTIDDGPDPRYTPAILDALREYDAHATFFVVGDAARRHPELIARMIDEGHEVAHHTYSHPRVERLSEPDVRREMDLGLSVLQRNGVRPAWYRPPRGALTQAQTSLAAERGMKIALWTRCMERSWFTSAQDMATTLAEETGGGDVVLAHDGLTDRSMTAQAIPLYLEALQRRGITVVTLSELEERAPLKPLGIAKPAPGHTLK